MNELGRRFPENPILRPSQLAPSSPGLEVVSLFNPGAFSFAGRIWLLVRVAERPVPEPGYLSTAVRGDSGEIELVRVRKDDPDLCDNDPSLFRYRGRTYCKMLSHLRLASSADGRRFVFEPMPRVGGAGALERYGAEDARVALIGGTYHIAYTSVGPDGFGVSCLTTRDWQRFESLGVLFPPQNKDVAFFEERIGGYYWALHRPTAWQSLLWLARSPDLRHWGGHSVLARPRPGCFDADKLGAGASPVRTAAGWLEIYHGVSRDATGCRRYQLGGLLLDLEDPSRVIARSPEPILSPTAEYERRGFLTNTVFTNGHVVEGDVLTVYYGACDSVVCGARFSIGEILASLRS